MRLNLKRPLVFFDLETTGTKVDEDRIVEISLLKLFPDGKEEVTTLLVNPTIPISPEASAIHGISDADVADKPTFKQLASQILDILKDSDLSGYNIHQFDLPLIRYEFLRIGIDFQIDDLNVVDPMMIYFKKEPRSLSAAFKYYCNQELVDAHSAEADIKATKDILLAQIERYNDVGDTVSNLADYSAPRFKSADLSRRLAYNDKDELIFNFGKYKGEPVKAHIDYAEWMLEKDFPEDTKNILDRFIKDN